MGRYRRRGLALYRAAPWRRRAHTGKRGSRKRSRRVGIAGVRTFRGLIRKVLR